MTSLNSDGPQVDEPWSPPDSIESCGGGLSIERIPSSHTASLEAALAYARQGWPVFPCSLDKRPHTAHGFKDATTDQQQVVAWWTRWPNALIGVPMGSRSGVFVADQDRKPGGADGVATWNQLVAEHGAPATLSAVTPSTGAHAYFRWRTGIRNVPLNALAPGIELKAEGGYIIVPPSRRPDGDYRWTNITAVADPPPWLLDRIFAHYARNNGGPRPGGPVEPSR